MRNQCEDSEVSGRGSAAIGGSKEIFGDDRDYR